MIRTTFTLRGMLGLAVGVAAVICGAPAGAQQQQTSERLLSFGIGLGVAAKPGGNVGSIGLGTLGFGTPWRNLDVRFDGAVMNWPDKISGGRVTSLTGNLVYSHRVGVLVPYVLGGIGGYAEQGMGTSLGVNGGVGARVTLGRVQPFIELREHVWSADKTHRATPFAIGFRF